MPCTPPVNRHQNGACITARGPPHATTSSLILGGALSIAAVAPAAAQTCDVDNRGGAAALVALVNANVGAGVNACQIDVDILNNSLNNLLRNADIHVIENILNNSPILNDSLNNLTINVEDVANGIQINVLGGGLNLTIIDPPA